MLALLVSALAQPTPDDLAAALPEARAQLETCATEGCEDAVGARAAWLVAVGTYTETGSADGDLAATVGVLDPLLHEKLPPVVRSAVGEPLAWAVPPSSPAGTAPSQGTWRDLPPVEPQGTLEVRVTDMKGRPIPGAFVRPLEDGDRHRVHSETGRWTTDLLYMADGSQRAIERNRPVRLVVGAPGHRPMVAFAVGKRRKTVLSFELPPMDVPADLQAGMDRWAAAEAVTGTSALVEAERAREDLAAQVVAALRAAPDDSELRDVCLTVADHATCGFLPKLPETRVLGDVDGDALVAAVDAVDVSGCADGLWGYVQLKLMVGTDGTVTRAEPLETSTGLRVGWCVADTVAAQAKLPAPSAGIGVVVHPVVVGHRP
ncbi:MAG: hypothetical protein KC656_18875 [Myxococcales bacterium]|nr:hypothetical protein [Myxococcales bacterium]